VPRLAAKIDRVPASGIRRVFEIALRLDDVTMLAVGEPDVPVATWIGDAARDAWDRDATDYSANGGIPPLRAAIVDRLARVNGLEVDVEQVWVTVGGTQALQQALTLLVGDGDEVLVPDPGYTTFRMVPPMLGAVAVPYTLAPERDFAPSIDELDALVTDRTRVLVVNSPSNPLGAVFDAPTLTALLDFARRHDLWVLSDEVYEAFTYDVDHVSPATLDTDGRVFSVFSCSKTYAMTGVRVGWLVTPPGFADTMRRVQEAAISCVAMPDQYAALAAITSDQSDVAAARAHYRDNLDASTAALDARGIRYLRPSGAFYLWVDVSHATDGDVAGWAERFLLERRVAVAPGSAFGRAGEGWIRVCAAASRDDLLHGLSLLPAPGDPVPPVGPTA
jgi:aspartate aminotransferase